MSKTPINKEAVEHVRAALQVKLDKVWSAINQSDDEFEVRRLRDMELRLILAVDEVESLMPDSHMAGVKTPE